MGVQERALELCPGVRDSLSSNIVQLSLALGS